MTLRLQNNQGAVQEYRDVSGSDEAREIISTWSDPEILKATLIDEGDYIWDCILANEV